MGLKGKCDISEIEYKALSLRLGIGCNEHTYAEIAKIMNTSKQRVQQLTNNAILKFRLCQEIKEYAVYLDAPDDFDYVSEEFENGLEQYQDEIGKNEMEL